MSTTAQFWSSEKGSLSGFMRSGSFELHVKKHAEKGGSAAECMMKYRMINSTTESFDPQFERLREGPDLIELSAEFQTSWFHAITETSDRVSTKRQKLCMKCSYQE